MLVASIRKSSASTESLHSKHRKQQMSNNGIEGIYIDVQSMHTFSKSFSGAPGSVEDTMLQLSPHMVCINPQQLPAESGGVLRRLQSQG